MLLLVSVMALPKERRRKGNNKNVEKEMEGTRVI